jgi:hypothetical protein
MECKHRSDEEYNGPCTLCLRDERRQHKEAESEHEKEYAVLRAQLAEKTAECERLRRESAEAFVKWHDKAFPNHESLRTKCEVFVSEECGGFARDLAKAEEAAKVKRAALAAGKG